MCRCRISTSDRHQNTFNPQSVSASLFMPLELNSFLRMSSVGVCVCASYVIKPISKFKPLLFFSAIPYILQHRILTLCLLIPVFISLLLCFFWTKLCIYVFSKPPSINNVDQCNSSSLR